MSKEYFNVSSIDNLKYIGLNGLNLSFYSFFHAGTPKIILNDGTLIAISDVGTNFKIIYVDINGLKKPNQEGKDLFLFAIQPNYGVTPYGFGNTISGSSFGTTYNRDTIINTSNLGCKKNSEGLWCSALIMSDGWEMKDDYPW